MNSCLIVRYKPSNEYEVLRYLSEYTMNNDKSKVDEYIKEYRKKFYNDHIELLEIKKDYYQNLEYDFDKEKWIKNYCIKID